MGRIRRLRKKDPDALPTFDAKAQLFFGYDDGCAQTVTLETQTPIRRGANRVDQCVVLRGRALDRICGAAFSLCGYTINPSLRALELHRWKNGKTTFIDFHRNHPDPDFDHVSLSVYDGKPGMRIWLQTPSTFHNFYFGKKPTTELLRRLAESAGWDADGVKPPPAPPLGTLGEEMLARVKKTFPHRRFPRVADVGGGDGHFSEALRDAGYKPTVIDPEASCTPRDVEVFKRKFLVQDADNFDLLVGLCPCSASQKLVRAAKRVPVVFVPCMCRSVWPNSRNTVLEAAAFLTKQKIPFEKKGLMFWTGAPN
jgi:hypothetical protein